MSDWRCERTMFYCFLLSGIVQLLSTYYHCGCMYCLLRKWRTTYDYKSHTDHANKRITIIRAFVHAKFTHNSLLGARRMQVLGSFLHTHAITSHQMTHHIPAPISISGTTPESRLKYLNQYALPTTHPILRIPLTS